MQQRFRYILVTIALLCTVTGGILLAQTSTPPAAPAATAAPATPPATADTAPATPAQPEVKESTVKPAPAAELKVFGRDLFSTAPSTYEPNSEAPVPPDYVLGTGDTISVVCWYGSAEYERSNVTITPNGDIYLKLVGNLPLAEKTLAQAQEELRRRYARFYTKFNLQVQVVGRRTIPVFVMGEVMKPGKYMLSSLSTVFTGLYAAGGPSDIGSLRRIRLMRGQRLVGEIDIYQYLLYGQAVDQPLKAGDTIYVPLAGKVVTVAGEVRRPAKYELLDKETLGDAIALAGGTTPTSSDHLRLSRIGDAYQRIVSELTLPADQHRPLRQGDEIMVTAVLPYVRNAVTLDGAVNRPGPYAIEQAPTVAALLKLADGLTPEAYAEQAIITRQQDNMTRQQIPVNLRAVLAGEKGADVTLHPGDKLQVFRQDELTDLLDRVRIEGEVIKPGVYPYERGMSVADLVQKAFGTTTKAYFSQAHLYRFPLGKQPEMLTIDLQKALAGDAEANLVLQPRDRLVVRSRDEVQDLIVRVEGEVNKPGAMPFYQGMRVSDIIFLAGGLKADVAMDRALLIRLNPATYAEELQELSLRGVLAHLPDQDVTLHNNDRLIVYPSSQVGDLRVVKVEGAVVEPGTYPFVGEMRVSHLLFMAKGLRQEAYPTRANLYRLRPDNTTEIIPVDLVTASQGQLTEANPLLTPRDRLVIATRAEMEEAKIVKIAGYVRKPGEFPLAVGMKLSDLLHLAGGLKPDADPKAELYRLDDGKVRTQTIALKETNGMLLPVTDVALEPNDLISVQGRADYVKMTETISIDGKVQHPGAYPAYQGGRTTPKTLFQALTEAGGLSADAYPAGIVLYRKQTAIHTERQQEGLIQALRDLDAGVGIPTKTADALPAPTPGAASASETTPAPETDGAATPEKPAAPIDMAKTQTVTNLSRSLAQVMTTDQGNTVVLVIPPRSMQEQQYSLSIPVDAEPIIRSQGKSGDIVLEPGDEIFVPKRPTTVTVLGGVVSNGSVVYATGKKLDYYLTAVGGVAPDGDTSRVIIMRMNGRVLPFKQAKAVEPGDIIIVPTKHLLKMIHTQGGFERALQAISKAALSFLPFSN